MTTSSDLPDLDSLPPELPQSSKTLTAQCHCKSIRFTVTIHASSLPLPVHLCHCPTCRYTHGTLCIFHASLPRGIQPEFVAPSSLSNATGYVHPHGALSERLFCSTCGCHFGDRDLAADKDTGKPEWRVATSIFDQHGEDTFQIRSHCFTDSALAGGLYDFLPKMGDRPVHVWNPSKEDKTWPPPPSEKDRPRQEFDERGNERLRAKCYCGGVSFTIPRPTIPEVTGDGFISQFVSPLEKDKWVACLDACNDCRLVDGTHVTAWTFVPLALLEPKIGQDLKIGTAKVYQSSEKVLRTFCGVCGATVFFDCAERRPSEKSHVIDVAVGILRAPEGVLAERWLTWRSGRVGWLEDGEGFDPIFARSLAKGHDEWGRQKYGRSLDFKIPG
ncbi:DUF636 domain protein [Coniochaeta sp. 2T2.1]|nr:DUF636 domain protein [Coniochaeta sp. 2T2.1]